MQIKQKISFFLFIEIDIIQEIFTSSIVFSTIYKMMDKMIKNQ